MINETGAPINFIGIGDHKSATTWLFQCLVEHPSICGPKMKETSFFSDDTRYAKGIKFYKTFFAHCNADAVIGEFSPSYLHNPDAPARIHTHLPGVKLIAVFRDPVEKAYSLYRFNKLGGSGSMARYSSFEDALEHAPSLTEDNFHYRDLESFLKLFQRDQILVVLYEDICRNPDQVVKDTYAFLGVDDNYIPPSVHTPLNQTGTTRLRFPFLTKIGAMVYHSLRKIPFFQKVFPFRSLKRLVSRYGHTKGGRAVMSYEPMKIKTKERLRALYMEDCRKLEKYLGRTLPWS